nr:zinc finger, CCHC-type [Tanacetum cinerariifolium]
MAILEDEEQEVSLHEKDVGYKETNMDSLWYLENRASNHMTGVREHFKELDEEVNGKVRFEDGSYIEIKGKGSILIECDDEKQRIVSHENGIARQLTAPYSPQQNGVVERRNMTIMSTTRCMMKVTNMPQNFWAEAVRHAIYILNSVPTKALEDITPYEAIKRRKPNLENLRVFDCIAYAKVPSQHLTKLDDRSTKMVYLGNEQGSKAYRLFDPTTQRVCVSRYVKFKEDEACDWKDYMNNEFPNNDDNDASPTRDSPLHSQTPHTPATQALWLKRLLSKLTHSQEEKVTIQVDNKSDISLKKNPVFHGRRKHIDTKSKDNMVRGTKKIKVEDLWKPDMCSQCKIFGHNDTRCRKNQNLNVRRNQVAANSRELAGEEKFTEGVEDRFNPSYEKNTMNKSTVVDNHNENKENVYEEGNVAAKRFSANHVSGMDSSV